MTGLSTPERNTGLESSQSPNVNTMPIPNRATFDSVTIALHWITVVLVLALLTTALLHAQSHDDATKALLLRIHRSLGVTVCWSDGLDDDCLSARLAHDECEIATV